MKNSKSDDVTQLINQSNLPLKNEIECLREIILGCDYVLEETIKWNGPNYQHNQNDRITLRIQDPKQIQIIFHRGAKVQVQPLNQLIEDEFNLLVWKENDRAIIGFTSMAEIINNSVNLKIILERWLLSTTLPQD